MEADLINVIWVVLGKDQTYGFIWQAFPLGVFPVSTLYHVARWYALPDLPRMQLGGPVSAEVNAVEPASPQASITTDRWVWYNPYATLQPYQTKSTLHR